MKFFNLFVVSIFLISCNEKNSTPNHSNSFEGADSTIVSEQDPYAHKEYDNIANYIACIEQPQNSPYKQLEELPFWKEEKLAYDSNWTKMQVSRLDPMKKWAEEEISPKINPELNVFYPFSGPDFLHANYIFPKAKNFTLMALEPVGEIPDLKTYSQDTSLLRSYLEYINGSLKDIYGKSYFITKHMVQDFQDTKAKGVIPVLLVFMKRTNHSIVNIEKLVLDSTKTIIAYQDTNKARLEKASIQGVKITFKSKEDTLLKTLTYWSVDILDQTVSKKYPYIIDYLNTLGPVNSFAKAASYLMHYQTFSKIRTTTLAISESILQDDTGIGFNYFNDKTQANLWTYHIYGKYTAPIKDFPGLKVQEALKQLYETDPNRKDLPFSLGYHWNDGYQNYMLAVKKKK